VRLRWSESWRTLAVALVVVFATFACSRASTEPVSEDDLPHMPLRQQEMGEDFAAFGAAGHRVSNSDAAQLLDDPTLTTSELDEAGRLSGYEITYYSFKSGAVLDQHFGLVNGVVGVELFESEAEASKYVLVLLDGYEHQEGRTFDQGVTVMFVQPFDVTKVSETARGLEMLAVQGSRSVYTTIVIFQTGRLVATAALSLANGAPVRNRVLEIAERLQARIDHVAAGGVTTQIVETLVPSA
jgi:hypothetical protein